MKNQDYKQKAEYLRSIGYSALADDVEELIQRINTLEKEESRLKSIIYFLIGDEKK